MLFLHPLLMIFFILAFPMTAHSHQKIVTHEIKIEVEKTKAKVLFHFKIPMEQAAMAITSMFPQIASAQPNETFEKDQVANFLFQQEKQLCLLQENSKNLLSGLTYQIKSKWPKDNTGIIEIMALTEFVLSPSSTKFSWSFFQQTRQIMKFETVFDAHYLIDTVETKPSSALEHVHKITLTDQKTQMDFAAERNILLILNFHKKHR